MAVAARARTVLGLLSAGSPAATAVERLFVYGTLKRGCAHHDLLAGARFAGAARTAPGFLLLDLGAYPGMVRGGSAAVAGELFEVDRELLVRLDRFEGHPHLFRRARVPLAGGPAAFAYLLDRRHADGRSAIPAAGGVARWRPP